MLNRLATMREERAEGDNGFTLIELLVVVVIIGILIAIAIPLYLNYRKGANDKSAASDLRGAVSVLEQCNSDNSIYPTPATNSFSTSPATLCTGQKATLSTGTTLTYYPNPAGTDGAVSGSNYIAWTSNSNGGGKVYCYSSVTGGSVKTVASVGSAYASTC